MVFFDCYIKDATFCISWVNIRFYKNSGKFPILLPQHIKEITRCVPKGINGKT